VRARDFILEDDEGSEYSKAITALSFIQDKVKEGKLSTEVPTQFVLRLIQNTGLQSFNYDDLVNANEIENSIKSILKKITPDVVTFNTGAADQVSNVDTDATAAVDNPEQVVSNMAKSAMKRRQD
jgi:hypothetical protein